MSASPAPVWRVFDLLEAVRVRRARAVAGSWPLGGVGLRGLRWSGGGWAAGVVPSWVPGVRASVLCLGLALQNHGMVGLEGVLEVTEFQPPLP